MNANQIKAGERFNQVMEERKAMLTKEHGSQTAAVLLSLARGQVALVQLEQMLVPMLPTQGACDAVRQLFFAAAEAAFSSTTLAMLSEENLGNIAEINAVAEMAVREIEYLNALVQTEQETLAIMQNLQ